MSFFGKFSLCVLLVAVLAAVSGCSPAGYSQADDEKEPHYVLGKSRVNAMDYSGAADAFAEALEVNPRSAPAHFQLACLYDTKLADPAAAIYHYQQYLRLSPHADNAEVIRQRIYSCKQQLAADVMPLPSAPAAQQQIEKLAEQNQQLQATIDHLNGVIKRWNAYYASLPDSVKNSPGEPAAGAEPAAYSAGSSMPDDVSSATVARATATAAVPSRTVVSRAAPAPANPRTHTVRAGETMASIARQSGISLTALQAANPGVVPKKMRVGQVLNLP
jgi:LysM repeat protein